MAKRGPKPLPDNVHRINGNPSKKNLSASGSDIPVEKPDVPENVNARPVALAYWNEVTENLFKLGLIAKIDSANLEILCINYADFVMAEKEMQSLGQAGYIQVTPKGYQQQSVWLQIRNRAADYIKSHSAEFGMSPSARVRVNPTPQMDMFGSSDSDGKESGKKSKPAESYFTN